MASSYQNPYMNAMTQGGALANQTAQTASSFGQNAIKGFDSSASIALKLDQLLMEEENHRDKMLMESQKQLADSVYKQQALALDTYKANSQVDYQNRSLAETSKFHEQTLSNDAERLKIQELARKDDLSYKNSVLKNSSSELKHKQMVDFINVQKLMADPNMTLEDKQALESRLNTIPAFQEYLGKGGKASDALPSVATDTSNQKKTIETEITDYDSYGNVTGSRKETIPMDYGESEPAPMSAGTKYAVDNKYVSPDQGHLYNVTNLSGKAINDLFKGGNGIKYMDTNAVINSMNSKDPGAATNSLKAFSQAFSSAYEKGDADSKSIGMNKLMAISEKTKNPELTRAAIIGTLSSYEKRQTAFKEAGMHTYADQENTMANSHKYQKTDDIKEDIDTLLENKMFAGFFGQGQNDNDATTKIASMRSQYAKIYGKDDFPKVLKFLTNNKDGWFSSLGLSGNSAEFKGLSFKAGEYASQVGVIPKSEAPKENEFMNPYTGETVYYKSEQNYSEAVDKIKNLSADKKQELKKSILLDVDSYNRGNITPRTKNAMGLFALTALNSAREKQLDDSALKLVSDIFSK